MKKALGFKRGRPTKYAWGDIGSTMFIRCAGKDEAAVRSQGASLRNSAANAGLIVSISRIARKGYVAATVISKA